MTNKSSPLLTVLAYGVHLYTTIGMVFAFLALQAIFRGDYRLAYLWLACAIIVDSSDGFLARLLRVKERAPAIDGAKLDDIIDYLTYTFVPVVLIWHAGFLPPPAWLWLAFPLSASLFTFTHQGAKEEEEGFFRGFPSYWNFVAFYLHVCFQDLGPLFAVGLLLFFSLLSVLPLRFIYPTRSAYWRPFFVGGAIVWTLVFLYMLLLFPKVPLWLAWASISYPLLYLFLSVFFDFHSRRHRQKKEALSLPASSP